MQVLLARTRSEESSEGSCQVANHAEPATALSVASIETKATSRMHTT